MKEKNEKREGEGIPFGPLPEYYNYQCSNCGEEYTVNEAIIDAEIGWAEFNRSYYEGYVPILGCPNCNKETLEHVKD